MTGMRENPDKPAGKRTRAHKRSCGFLGSVSGATECQSSPRNRGLIWDSGMPSFPKGAGRAQRLLLMIRGKYLMAAVRSGDVPDTAP